MTSRQEIGTSPLEPPLAEQQTTSSQTEAPHASPTASSPCGHRQDQRLPSQDAGEEEERDAGFWSHNTPSSTPTRPYRFSEHIHKDRHIFLKGASLGIGCGTSASPAAGLAVAAGGGGLTADVGGPDWAPWTGEAVRRQGFFVDEHGNVFCNGQFLGMALGDERLPVLHRVQLALPSAGWGNRQRPRQRFPHVHPQHQPPELRRRPFNEQLNTYVDTQKRIRSVQCLDDLYRSTTPSPVFPYLSTPSPRRPRPPPPPARIRGAGSRGGPPGCATSPRAAKGPARAAGKGAAGPESGSSSDGPHNPDAELAQARQVMQELQKVSTNQSYADYFLDKEGCQGSLGRLFESYPKRVLVHPGRLLRQRSDIVSRAKLNMLR